MKRDSSKHQEIRNKNTHFSLTTKVITIFITLLNLGLAGITVYYNYFRVEESLEARITWTNSEEITAGDTLSINVVIFNSGNRQAIISEMFLANIFLNNGKPSSWSSTLQNFTRPQLPILIEPGHTCFLNLRSPYVASDWFLNSKSCDSTDLAIVRLDSVYKCANLGIVWTAINSKAKTFNGIGIVARINVTKNSIGGVGYSDNLLNLYSNR